MHRVGTEVHILLYMHVLGIQFNRINQKKKEKPIATLENASGIQARHIGTYLDYSQIYRNMFCRTWYYTCAVQYERISIGIYLCIIIEQRRIQGVYIALQFDSTHPTKVKCTRRIGIIKTYKYVLYYNESMMSSLCECVTRKKEAPPE